MRRSPHREFVHVRLGDNQHAVGPQSLHCGRFVRTLVSRQNSGSAGGGQSERRNVVLDRDGYSGQHAYVSRGAHPLPQFLGCREAGLFVRMQEDVERVGTRTYFGGARERSLNHVGGRCFSAANAGRDRCRAKFCEVLDAQAPLSAESSCVARRGTIKNPSRITGANDSSVPFINGGTRTSGRKGVPPTPTPAVGGTAAVST